MSAVAETDTGPDREFAVEIAPRREQVHVRLRGELDVATVPAVEQQVEDLYAAGWSAVVLDMRDVGFMDSSGLKLLLRLQMLAGALESRSLRLANCSAPVRRVLELTRLHDRFAFAD